MTKDQFYLAAILAQAYIERSWVIRAFSLFQEAPDAWKGSLQPFRLTLNPTGYAFVNPDNKETLTPIEGADASKPLFAAFESLMVPANTLPFWPEGGLTTYGNLLFNACIFYAIGPVLPYVNEWRDAGKIEQYLIDISVDDPAEGQQVPSGKISISQYLRFCDAIRYLEEFTQLFTYGLTEKAITPPPNVAEFKQQLFEKYAGKLNDPLTQTRIYKELEEFDAQYLKGDDSERFLISAKSRGIVRRKLFLIQGAEAGLTNSQELPLIKNSLSEGWEKSSVPQLIDTLRAGSFDRGSETELGGVEAKWILRSTSNIRVVEGDCGTKLGMVTKIGEHNFTKLIKRYIFEGEDSRLINTVEEAKAYVGKEVSIRTPGYCHYKYTDYCPKCLGERLAANPDGVSMAAAALGGGFLTMFLKAMHGKQMTSARMDVKAVFS